MRHIFLSAILAFGCTTAHAATITGGFATKVNLAGQPQVNNNTTGNNVVRSLTGNEMFSATSTDSLPPGPGFGQGSGSFDIDQASGEIKFGVSATVTAPAATTRSTANAGMSVAITELFDIQGTGDITFRLAIDGILTAPIADGFSSAGAGASIRLRDKSGGFGSKVLGFESVNFVSTPGLSTIFDDVLEFTATITKADTYEFRLGLNAGAAARELGQGNSASSSADFLNTAFLSFDADDTLTVTASDTRFLGGSTPPPPAVPLPAGALLLVTGLAVLRRLKRR